MESIMIRAVIGVLGAVTALFPRAIIALFEGIAIEQPETAVMKSRSISAIRAEGIIILIASLAGGRAYTGLMNLTGLFGSIVVLKPDVYRRFATNLLYENPNTVEWNEQFDDQVRLIGLFYVLVAVGSLLRRNRTN